VRIPSVCGADVEVLSWPQDAERLEALRAAGRPRLLLVPAAAVPPVVDDELEDWVRLPADADEVRLRRRRVRSRSWSWRSRAPPRRHDPADRSAPR
jgi:hypothetical protein